jgi:malate dehydrogenase (oxaloacetate-decarboxylating)
MCIAAAEALAVAAPDAGMNPECILPTMEDWDVFAQEAVAVGMKAQEQGIARVAVDAESLFRHAATIIARARGLTASMMAEGFIAEPPEAEAHDV